MNDPENDSSALVPTGKRDLAKRTANLAQRGLELLLRNEALHQISAEMSSCKDLKTMLEKLALFCKQILPYDYLTVSFTEGEGAVRFKMLEGYYDYYRVFYLDNISKPISFVGSLLGWIIENCQELCFSDIDPHDERLPIFPAKVLHTDSRSFLAIPLISHDKVFGVITFASKQSNAIGAYQHNMLSIVVHSVAANIAAMKSF